MKKIISVVGARPNFIKLDSHLPQIIVHTGQHYDIEMSQVFFDDLNLPVPKYNLGCNQNQVGKMILKLGEVYEGEKPDLVLVYGDTNSTVAGAIAAYQQRISVGHIEAGLRGYNRQMLEEYNRVISDHVADYNFCPTPTAMKNLKKEGLTNGYFVGDVMYDRILDFKKKIGDMSTKNYILLTLHRAENVDSKNFLRSIFRVISKLKLEVVFPVHPRTSKRIRQFKLVLPRNIKQIKPVGYTKVVKLACQARVVITDSGGLQKEAYFLGTPCLIIRSETEWSEIVDNRSVFLINTKELDQIPKILEKDLPAPRVKSSLFGDGKAWVKIKKILKEEKFL